MLRILNKTCNWYQPTFRAFSHLHIKGKRQWNYILEMLKQKLIGVLYLAKLSFEPAEQVSMFPDKS